ncbi:MAG: ATP-binding protein [Fibrobacterota bacterium]
MKPVKREILKEFLSLMRQYPVVTITGPRQSGKTTLAKSAFPKLPYYSLESPDVRSRVLRDPRAFLAGHPDGMVIDEIQKVPELPSYLQGVVDEHRKKGLFVLTGSRQFEIMSRVSQSLAGRTALLKLLPFSFREISLLKGRMDADALLLNGCYPRVYSEKQEAYKSYRNYFETYVERDLRDLLAVKDLAAFEKFVRLCAGRIGGILNASALAGEVGVSYHTIQSWLSILQASYLIFLLQPYYGNIGKRIVKSPKIYFYDTGLAAFLLGIDGKAQIENHPLRGMLFENMVILELMKSRFNRGYDHDLFYYRDNNGNEVDVIFKTGAGLVPVEIKSSSTFHVDYLKGLEYFRKIVPKECRPGYLVYSGKNETLTGNWRAINFIHARDIVEPSNQK